MLRGRVWGVAGAVGSAALAGTFLASSDTDKPIRLEHRQPSYAKLEALPYVQKLKAEGFRNLNTGVAPTSHRQQMFSVAVLTGRGRIEQGPLILSNPENCKLITVYQVGQELQGVHSDSAVATILDEGLAECAFQKLPSKLGVTATLDIETLSQIPQAAEKQPVFLALEAELESQRSASSRPSRKAVSIGTLWSLNDAGDATSQKLATGRAIMVEPRWGTYLAWIKPLLF